MKICSRQGAGIPNKKTKHNSKVVDGVDKKRNMSEFTLLSVTAMRYAVSNEE